MKLVLVTGARPNFMKVAPLVWELRKRQAAAAAFPLRHLLVHTGQHYDREMMSVFLDEFGLPAPDFNPGVGPGSHALQTARIMVRFEKLGLKERPFTVSVGTNRLIGSRRDRVGAECRRILAGKGKVAEGIPELWDGRTAERIIDVFAEECAAGVGKVEDGEGARN